MDIRDVIRSRMPVSLYTKPGAVLLSGAVTLKPSPVYVMGLNPGGDPDQITRSIIDSITPPDGTSAYTHECWQPRCMEPQPCRHMMADGRTRPDALVRHQRNMIALAAALQSEPARLFSANAIFARSSRRSTLRQQTGLDLAEWWQACWPVHQAFLSIVRPRMIVTLGYGERSSAFGLLRAKAGSPAPSKVIQENQRGGWLFSGQYRLDGGESLPVSVIGVPHPSYFAPGEALAAWLSDFIEGGVP